MKTDLHLMTYEVVTDQETGTPINQSINDAEVLGLYDAEVAFPHQLKYIWRHLLT